MSKFVLNKAGVGELLKSAEMLAVCKSHAADIMSKDKGEHTMYTRVGRSRVCAEVIFRGEDAEERKGAWK